MRKNRFLGLIITFVLLLSIIGPIGVYAEDERTLKDESIYDLLVDRFFNENTQNDEDVDTQNPYAFSGGDFAGIINRMEYIKLMGFTMISIGPIFQTEMYDGSQVLDYEKLEPHFGTEDDLAKMIDAVHKQDISVMADFPLNGVSENHIWIKDGLFTGTSVGEGIIDWDASDSKLQEALKSAIISFVEKNDLDGIRLTKISKFDTPYINEVISAIKDVKPDMYVITNEVSEADFDGSINQEKIDALKQSFVSPDSDSSVLSAFTNMDETDLIQFDDLTGSRFTYDMMQLRMFPPTRWKMAVAALFTLPGTPVMTYGTEIAVNGEKAPESHPLSNFNTDMELYEYIGGLNSLRNDSEALRTGDFELLHDDQGFTVYKVSNDDETWIVALNNKATTSNYDLSAEIVGENKKFRGVLDGDLVREADDNIFRIVLEREVAEIYIVEEDKGFNTPYLIASLLVYVLFLSFLYVVWKRGRKTRASKTE
ncbi:alpha-amylase family glycosyl hydrolase [Sporosarcina siberiensis]|uniref:Alpha-amylase family glycosyl hydrolase n=1 Tax=Sporosarcina siberiensis TaxID=1365606 RepID=A0ABW4SEQ9_9BACL